MRDEHFPLHLHHSTIDDYVTVHGAVMSDNNELVNVGDFVATSDLAVCPFRHVTPFLLSRYNILLILRQIGVLLTCYKVQHSYAVCLLRELLRVCIVFDVAMPQVMLLLLFLICCSASCGIIEDEVHCTLEREVIQSTNCI